MAAKTKLSPITPLERQLYEALHAVGEDLWVRDIKLSSRAKRLGIEACNAYLVATGGEAIEDQRPRKR